LTDSDLNALLRWTQDKQRLIRYRDGWGVASGLQISCDPKRPGQIVVGTGYAVTCCGDDVVVCSPTTVDLRRACCGGRDPDCGCNAGSGDGAVDGATSVRQYDIHVRYVEQPSDPQPALRRGYTGDSGNCDFGRTRETFQIVALPAEDDDPLRARAARWQSSYESCLEVLERYATASFHDRRDPYAEGGEAVRRWLLRWLDAHPLRQFCWVRDEICAVEKSEEFNDERRVLRWLFLIVQDCRLAYLAACDDGSCACDQRSGVPIGRVWVETSDGRGTSSCRITCLDQYPPYRRELGRDCWPADPGDRNLGRLVWRRDGYADAEFASMQIRVGPSVPFDLEGFNSVEHLRNELTYGRIVIGAGDRVQPRVWESKGDCGGRRIVDFVPVDLDRPRLIARPERAPVHEPDLQPEPEPRVDEPPAPAPEPTPDPADLTRVIGIGKVTAKRLDDAGIHDLRSLAAAHPDKLIEVVPRLNPTEALSWKEQARDLLG
jgi:predicted flap endonuclease-1-like 5' DNA nuclease